MIFAAFAYIVIGIAFATLERLDSFNMKPPTKAGSVLTCAAWPIIAFAISIRGAILLIDALMAKIANACDRIGGPRW